MGMSGIATAWRATALAGVLALTGCTDSGAGAAVAPDAAATTEPEATATGTEQLSAFEQQLPLRGEFVSQQTETTGSVLIERHSDGTTWLTLDGFATGDASDLRLHLKEGALEQDAAGFWVDTAGYSFEIAPLDPEDPGRPIEIPGAHIMPTIRTLTVMDSAGPDYPSLGSVALAR